MQVDQYFRQLERTSERNLYRRTNRAIYTSQRKALDEVFSKRSVIQSRKFALEFLWFFVALLIGFVLGYVLFTAVEYFLPNNMFDVMVTYLGGEIMNFLYFLSFLCFLGVYITRVTVWAFTSL